MYNNIPDNNNISMPNLYLFLLALPDAEGDQHHRPLYRRRPQVLLRIVSPLVSRLTLLFKKNVLSIIYLFLVEV